MDNTETLMRGIQQCLRDFDVMVDELAERLYWEYDARRKQTGMERDAFKSAVREAVMHFEPLMQANDLARLALQESK